METNVTPTRSSHTPHAEQASREKRSLEKIRQRRNFLASVRAADRFPDAYDAIWPAQAIDRHFSGLSELGKTARDVKEALESSSHRVQHWERLRINGAKSPGDAKANLILRTGSDALVKKVQPYVQLLEALARVSGADADDMVASAFENTRFARASDARPSEPFDDLLWLLDETAQAVIERENLREYFEQARTTYACYDPVTCEFLPSQLPGLITLYLEGETGDTYVPSGFIDEASRAWEGWPAFPSVTLTRVCEHVLSSKLYVSNEIVAPIDNSVEEVSRLASPLRPPTWHDCPESLEGYRPIDAQVEIFSDVRLVIGPRRSENDIGLMFECGSFVRLKTEAVARTLTFPYSVDPMSAMDGTTLSHFGIGLLAAKFDDGWRRIAAFGDGIKKPEIERIDGNTNCESRLTWHPVNVQNLENFSLTYCAGKYIFEGTGPFAAPKEIWLPSCPQFLIDIQTGALAEAFSKSCRQLQANLALRRGEAVRIRETEISEYLNSLEQWKSG